MRLATFNVLHGRSPEDGVVDLERFAAALKSLDADVLALQEVDRNQARSAHADLTAVAAEAMGARQQRFVAALAGTPGATWTAATGREQPDAAAYGIALLSRYPVRSWRVVRLPAPPTPLPMWFRGRALPALVRDEPRVALAARIATPLGEVAVVNTHLSFVRTWGRHQLRTLVAAFGDQPPLLLTGDLNMSAASAQRSSKLVPLVHAETFPAHAPVEQLDHILAGRLDGTWSVAASAAHLLPVSDHRALTVDLG